MGLAVLETLGLELSESLAPLAEGGESKQKEGGKESGPPSLSQADPCQGAGERERHVAELPRAKFILNHTVPYN